MTRAEMHFALKDNKPRAVVLGHADYDSLYFNVITSHAEFVPDVAASILVELTRRGIQGFYWDGILFIRCENQPTIPNQIFL